MREHTHARAAGLERSRFRPRGSCRNQDNFNVFGCRVNPPDPVGDVGPNHYVEMINLVFGVYDKTGTLLLGPVDTGTLWAGFAVEDCTDPPGDPIVLYDQIADRWILTQFTTRGLDDPSRCRSTTASPSRTTGDPTGAYYRYAFITQPDTEDGGYFFPDYPKYGVWRDSYIMTTRDFGLTTSTGSASTGSRRTRWSTATRMPAPCSSSSTRTSCRST